jgi:hypothetical protein
MVKALAHAHRWQRLQEVVRYASTSDIAAAEKLDRGYIGQLLRLTLLAPDIVEAVLDGRHSPKPGLPRLMEPWPTSWDEHRLSFAVFAI